MPAQSITFNVTAASESGAWTITKAWIGDLVDPETGAFEGFTRPEVWLPFGNLPSAESSSFTWTCATPAHCVPFGLNFQFQSSFQNKSSKHTAIGHLAVDPTKLSGDPVIDIYLAPCEMSPGHPGLNVTIKSGPATVKPTQGQGTCRPPTVDVLMLVHVLGTLSQESLSDNLFMIDSFSKSMVRYQKGKSQIETSLHRGGSLVWRALPISFSKEVSIQGFSGTAVTDKVITPVETDGGSWKALFQPGATAASGTVYPYTVAFDIYGSEVSFDTSLKIEAS